MPENREALKNLIAERAHIKDGHFRTPSGIITEHFDFLRFP